MDSKLTNISNIEDFLDGIFRGKLTDNLFYTDFPRTIDSKWNEIVVVDFDVDYLDAFGRGFVNVFIYAKPRHSGMKDSHALSILENKLDEIVQSSSDPNYKISKVKTYSDYDEQRNLYCNVVSLNLLII